MRRDHVTGLAFRPQGLVRLGRRLRAGARPTVAIVAVNDLASIRETFGDRAADRALRSLADTLVEMRGAPEAVTLLGAGEFLVILDHALQAETLAARLLVHSDAPFTIGGAKVLMDLTVGIAAEGEGGPRPVDLVETARAGLRAARERGTSYAFAPTGSGGSGGGGAHLGAQLREALKRDEVVVAYQPVIDIGGGGGVRGAEALVRWRKPDGRMLSPGVFLPAAEAAGLMGVLGEHVLRAAARQWVALFGADGGGRTLAVNVATRQLTDPWFADSVLGVLEEAGLAPSALELEITEQALLADTNAARSGMAALVREGVRFAVDDFGTGYSSLALLTELPFSTVKLDRSLVAGVASPSRKRAAVEAVCLLAERLDLDTIAEGIEEAAQLDAVGQLGAQLAQGFLIARPDIDLPAAMARAAAWREPPHRRSGTAGA